MILVSIERSIREGFLIQCSTLIFLKRFIPRKAKVNVNDLTLQPRSHEVFFNK